VTPVGIGIVGLGRWSNAHAAAASRTDSVSVVTGFSRDPERRKDFASAHGLTGMADSFESLLGDERVDAVVIATPNDLHVEMAQAALEAGKPALIDKPVSVDLPSGLALMRAHSGGGSQLGIAHHARRLAGIRAIQRWLASGDAGQVRMAHADFSNARGAAMKPGAWHRTVKGSEAGVLIQVGIHQVDNVLSLLGPPTAVNARFQHQTMGRLPDSAVVVIQHAGGAVSTVTSSWTTPALHRIEVQATGGNMRLRADHSFWTSPDLDDHTMLTFDRDGQAEEPWPKVAGDPLAEQLDELAGAVRGTATMEVDVAAGLRAMAVVVAAVKSAEQRGAEIGLGNLLAESGASPDEVQTLTGAI
jgi:predicted dehydrogenase